MQIGGERRRLTFRALDVEQIGYVYEGLLELESRTATDVILGLARPAAWPRVKHDCEVTLTEVIAQQAVGTLPAWLAERTGWSAARTRTALDDLGSPERRAAVARVIGAAPDLVETIAPFAGVLRYDERGLPAITRPGGRFIARSSRRAATGTHYTPRSLAEEVASGALQPLVYRPGPLETADETTWRPRPSSEILQLKVADIAMGSGAFLVAACRYLADRLVEAWQAEGRADALASQPHREGHRLGADAEAEHVLLDARRLITEHCLYGVDINPLAVEMAKLSLWLITMDRERPFGFLDDRLVPGDSLLGLTGVDQLEELHVDPVAGRRLHAGTLDITDGWRSRLQQAADLRRRITAAPVVTIRDVEHKARLLADARDLSGTLQAAADAVTAAGLAGAKLHGKKCDAEFLALSVQVSNAVAAGWDSVRAWGSETLQAGRPEGTVPRSPLHWPTAFPEVFADTAHPGFDAIVGNPPFSGGNKVSSAFGDDYLAWLQRWDGRDVKGSADLAARFVLRAERLLNSHGQLGFVTVNTLVEGATLRVGLEQATGRDLTIRRGRTPHPWPTASANLQIVETWASRAPLGKSAIPLLDGEEVPAIGPDLQPYGRVRGRPMRLRQNAGIAFHGTFVSGLGFTLSTGEKDQFIAGDPKYSDVIQPYINGKDVNQRIDCSASRWIINFRDWPLERAEKYPACIQVVRNLVKPQRDRDKREQRRKRWWIYAERAPKLYEAVEGLDSALALAQVSNTLIPVRVPIGQVFDQKCVVFAVDDFASMALLSSSIHTIWAIRYTATMRTDISYSPTDAFLTLSRPAPTSEAAELGEKLDFTRQELMRSRSWGLTTTYNHVHDPYCRDYAVSNLRDLHAAIDEAVMRAYGWEDLDLKIGHHPTKIGVRWTVSKEARFELLDRLLEENQQRYREENP
ncbi:MAG: Eco57I restriction-modification methylase domain-containing protein [Streptosporangiaceae bacterium]